MTEEQIKALYNAEIENSAPDKDALWAKIESRLTPKAAPVTTQAQIAETSTPKTANRKKPIYLTVLKYAAACAVLLIAVPAVFNVIDNNITSDNAPIADTNTGFAGDTNSSAEENTDAADSDASEAPSDSESVNSAPEKLLSYSELTFPSYSETYYSCDGIPYGGSYFVEEDILKDTDEMIIGEVGRVSLSDDGSSIVYELVNVEGYGELTVESRSPYTMRRGRQYLLPLAKTEGGWRTVYDNVPQIEFTSDGGIVYYNGWESLDSDRSQNIIYPQDSVDEFFYDRMMFDNSGDVSGLINKWKAAKQA